MVAVVSCIGIEWRAGSGSGSESVAPYRRAVGGDFPRKCLGASDRYSRGGLNSSEIPQVADSFGERCRNRYDAKLID